MDIVLTKREREYIENQLISKFGVKGKSYLNVVERDTLPPILMKLEYTIVEHYSDIYNSFLYEVKPKDAE